MGIFFQSAFRDNTITCNEARDVDLDALNMLASGEHDVLCTCAYRNEKGHHHFVYDTQGMTALTQTALKLEFGQTLGLLAGMLSLVDLAEAGRIDLENLKIAKEYIFCRDEEFRFIYIPIAAKKTIRTKDAILRLLSVIRQKDPRVQQLVRDIRKARDNAQAAAYLRAFVNSFGVGMAYTEADTTVLAGRNAGGAFGDSEGETTVLSQIRDEAPAAYQNFSADAEGETTVLSQIRDEAPAAYQNFSADAEGETTVLSQMGGVASEGYFDAQSHTPDAEGETTVLSRMVEDNHERAGFDLGAAADEEGETTVLSQVGETGYTRDGESGQLTVFYTDESAEMETMILTSAPELPWEERPAAIDGKHRLSLLNNLTGELVPVEVTPFTIGKDRANMDHAVDNDSVSRHHATVVYENGIYYIMDNHSTNGTRVEGIRLQPGEKAELEHGYMLTLGKVSFQTVLERR